MLSLFGGPRYFVDIGANDGRLLSNSVKLEEAGWQGVFIDPFPSNHDGNDTFSLVSKDEAAGPIL